MKMEKIIQMIYDIINYFYDYGIYFLYALYYDIKKKKKILKMVLKKEIIKIVVLGYRFKCFLLFSNIVNCFLISFLLFAKLL
jgi:hypothetical protein